MQSSFRPIIIVNTASPARQGWKPRLRIHHSHRHAYILSCAAQCPLARQYIYISSSSIVTGAPFSLLSESEATVIDPTSHHDPYSAAKAIADAHVLAANESSPASSGGGLRPALLRQSGIIDQRDTQVVPALLTVLGQGMARIQLGEGKSNFDFILRRERGGCVCAMCRGDGEEGCFCSCC